MKKLEISVLFVEDEPLVREVTNRILQKMVSTVYIASDGLEGLESFKKNQPDVLLTDINLPNMDGLTLGKLAMAKNKDVQVIIITAHTDTEYLLDAIKTRVHAFIVKPLDKDFLYSLLAKLTRELRLKKEVQKHTIRMQTLLDFQADMLIMTDGRDIYEANKKFLYFFNCSNLEDFKNKHQYLPQVFSQEEGYVFSEDCSNNWLNTLNENPPSQNKVKIFDKRTEDYKTFLIKYNKIPYEDNYIISFVDITELDKQTASLEKEANMDQLTRIYNRRKFNEVISELIKEAQNGISLSLIIFDIDHFKQINDTYGHDKGDEVLIELSRIIKAKIRSSDTFCRWGGEEFIILCSKTSLEGAENLAEKIRILVSNHNFPITRNVTISLGISEYHNGESSTELMSRADKALYRAKSNGRNRLEIGEL
ncbi:MAG: diguanylate cyclase [Leptospiraceae bacterium]|nr:diguanylate cyclase [Leptospiraceae bacterium]MCP5500373.1 diguanylate cyclase [Leptospiraceae bacterium]